MKISIAERFCPFSHTPGASCLIPGTLWQIQAFPTLIRLSHREKRVEIALGLTGPFKEWTLQQDLEKERVTIFGSASDGYIRLHLSASALGFTLYADKTPGKGLATSFGVLEAKKEIFLPFELAFQKPLLRERFSFGCHRKQDVDLMRRRLDLGEMLPFLFFLGNSIPPVEKTPSFFPSERKNLEKIMASFFLAHTESLFSPRLVDDQHQGIRIFSFEASMEPAALLWGAAHWARSFFIGEEATKLAILPHLPSQFPSGRIVDVQTEEMGSLDVEWSKSSLKKVIFRSRQEGESHFIFPKSIRSFRVRTKRAKKGRCQKTAEPFMVKAGTTYFLDRFSS